MKKTIRPLITLVAITALFMALTSVGFAADAQGSRTLTIGLAVDIRSVDPQGTNTGSTHAVLYNVFTGLFKIDINTAPQPELAVDYKQIDDRTWEFTLRDDAYFHNGDKVTAADMAFSLNRVRQDSSLGEKIHFDGIEDAIALDDTHLRVVTKEPMPTMISLLAKSGSEALPHKYIEEKGWDYFFQHPIGSGPYKLDSYIRDDSVTLSPFDKYYGAQNNDWDKVVYRVIPESSTRVGELISGNVNLINNVIPSEWDRVNGNESTYIQHAPSSRTYQIALKTNEPFPTSDIRVREAIDWAINDKLIVDNVLRGAGRVTLTRIPEGIFGNEPSLLDNYNYDPVKAKELLKEAGFENGFDLTFQAPNGSQIMDSEIAQVITAMLGEVGIRVKLELLEPSAYLDVYNTRTPKDAFLTCFGLGFFDAAYGLVGYTEQTSRGMTNWADPYYNETFIATRANMNREEREKGFQELQKYISVERPYICMASITVAYGVQKDIDFKGSIGDVFDLLNIHRK
ncbi:MAG: ABC transporter substrate-binding protein [Synergistaceae bacterium]|nr:ABC transporter substrate-binding protein [Synergistaceae bacterium]